MDDRNPPIERRRSLSYIFLVPLLVLCVVLLLLRDNKLAVYLILATIVGTTLAAIRLSRHRLLVNSERIAVGTQSIAWSDVDHYTYVSVGTGQPSLPLAKMLIDATRGDRYRTLQFGRLLIHGRDGRRLRIGNEWRNPREALDAAFAQLHARLDPLAPRGVAPFQFLPHALAHPCGELVYEDIERVELRDGGLLVFQRGRDRWVSEPMRKIHNLLLLLEQFANRGIEVAVDSNLFIPASMVSRIVPTGGSPSPIPAARIHQES